MPDIETPNEAVLENVKLIFRNFSGEEKAFNAAGKRNFAVLLPDKKTADAMAADGWVVKTLDPKDEDDDVEYFIKVQVSYKGRPPMVVLVTQEGRRQTKLGSEDVGMLDWAEIVKADLILEPYLWEINGKEGVSAYLKSLYVTIHEDPLAAKYNAMLLGKDEDE